MKCPCCGHEDMNTCPCMPSVQRDELAKRFKTLREWGESVLDTQDALTKMQIKGTREASLKAVVIAGELGDVLDAYPEERL